jgi:serine/threonine protein kinase
MSWGTGQQLNNNRYEIVERIGTGGFGVTYKALDRETANTVVAIKTLNEKRQRQANFNKLQDNFLNEALSLAKCSHPHVIRVERVFSEGQVWAMVMEYIDGETLEDRIIDKGRMAETQAVEIIQKIGSAVSYVHSQQLIHRDIKPANILEDVQKYGEMVKK